MARKTKTEDSTPDHNGAGLRIGIVMARFSIGIGEGLLAACTAALEKQGVAKKDIEVVTVPGALEIPLTLKAMAISSRYDALVALGSVIRGETYHFEIVSNESARGITDVQLETGVPVANGILTTENDAQAEVRVKQKGIDCALAAIEMARLMQQMKLAVENI
jgi:6,7-dimethyl-8-ribityllumazine synthase